MPVHKIEKVGCHRLQKIHLSIEGHVAVITLPDVPEAAAAAALWYEVWYEISLACDYINENLNVEICFLRADLKTFCFYMGSDKLLPINLEGAESAKDLPSPPSPRPPFHFRVPLICDLNYPPAGKHVMWVCAM